jgi:hypothetical protein
MNFLEGLLWSLALSPDSNQAVPDTNGTSLTFAPVDSIRCGECRFRQPPIKSSSGETERVECQEPAVEEGCGLWPYGLKLDFPVSRPPRPCAFLCKVMSKSPRRGLFTRAPSFGLTTDMVSFGDGAYGTYRAQPDIGDAVLPRELDEKQRRTFLKLKKLKMVSIALCLKLCPVAVCMR